MVVHALVVMPSKVRLTAIWVGEPMVSISSKIRRTTAASVSLMTGRRLSTSYPSGGTPPIHIPLRLLAAILSGIRSPVTSRSNWAKDNSTFSISRPIEVVVLNCCVTDTNDTPWRSNTSTILEKSARLRVRRSIL